MEIGKFRLHFSRFISTIGTFVEKGKRGRMADEPIMTRPVNENENLLRKKFYESMAAQSDLMDKLGEKLITLELAIPGIYAAVLKLMRGDKATVTINAALYLTFICWLLALALTLLALTPKKWRVDTNVLKQDPKKYSEGLGIEDFFEQSARYKRGWLSVSSILFFAGVVCAAFTL